MIQINETGRTTATPSGSLLPYISAETKGKLDLAGGSGPYNCLGHVGIFPRFCGSASARVRGVQCWPPACPAFRMAVHQVLAHHFAGFGHNGRRNLPFQVSDPPLILPLLVSPPEAL